MNNQSNAVQGRNVEHLLKNSLQDHHETFNKCKKVAGIPLDAVLKRAEVIGGQLRKTDVEFEFENCDIPLTFNVKSFGGGYNHLERRKFTDFCRRNQIKKADEAKLKKMILRKAEGGCLVEPKEEAMVQRVFSPLAVGCSALLGNDHPKLLALYSLSESTFKIYDMCAQVIPLVGVKSISFTETGGNIQIGKYIVIQRKGSEGKRGGNSTTDIDHASNNIQIKMWARKFYENVEPVCWYSLTL